jgi:exodeoxyribonuclease V alpha subunit
MRRRSRAIELTEVHRFRDPDYAAVTLRLREPADLAAATAAARALAERGLIEVVPDAETARESMVSAWLAHADKNQRVALVTSTNAEAQVINDRIQQERIDRGDLDPSRWATGQDGQFLLVGDIVQTRRNDSAAGVENRATWTVARIDDHEIALAAIDDPSDVRTVGRRYAAEHMHLAYASTVHGIQGDTVHTAYVGPDVDAAGLYVGMTRGRHRNVALVRATSDAEAIDAIAETALRGRAEVTLEDSRRAARRELDRSARARTNRASSVADRLVDVRNEGRELDVALATEDALAHGRRAPDIDVLRERRDAVADAVGRLHRSMRASRVSRESGSLDPVGAELLPSAESAGRGVSI